MQDTNAGHTFIYWVMGQNSLFKFEVSASSYEVVCQLFHCLSVPVSKQQFL
jgi:hypothetical protein